MKTELVHLDSLLLGGVNYYGDPISTKGGWDSENEIGKTWERFVPYIAACPERPYSAGGQCCYEVHVYGDETAVKGYFEVFVGKEVSTAQLPITMVSKFIPASDYLKITLIGNEITGDWWKRLDTEMITAYKVRRNDTYIIQAYDERFKGMDRISDSELDAYIPVCCV